MAFYVSVQLYAERAGAARAKIKIKIGVKFIIIINLHDN